eukprot:TRINITY_DN5991_c0_g2_i2.p1 TRINITY_DN5991_c0_g2~~TRINITY_DN5991_c0_g2_i2.p1  ORF type:complete len:270 (+),score=70.17 TRINITY_DN5991_c0_g2_i2:26-811(+)
MEPSTPKQICFAIDRGGTFTDIYAFSPDTPSYHRVYKLLSVDLENYDDAPREGIRRILQEDAKIEASDPKNVDSSAIGYIRMGTTVATNALLERKGERTALFITSGFNDLLQIGNQARPEIFDLEIKKPDLLYESVVEVNERVQVFSHDYYHDEETVESSIAGIDVADGAPVDIHVGTTGEKVRVITPLDKDQVMQDLQTVYDSGIRSLAVVFMHSYTFPEHEKLVGEWATEIGFTHVSLSSQLMPMVRAVPRGHTSCVDA